MARAQALADAYAYCARLARSHYENFTIASWLMPRAMRPHMHAIYAYARMADDFADEEQDLAKLDAWERELDLAYAGAPRHPVFVALADTVRVTISRASHSPICCAHSAATSNFSGFDTIDDCCSATRVIRRIRSGGWSYTCSAIATRSVRGSRI